MLTFLWYIIDSMKEVEFQNRDTETKANNYWDELSTQKMIVNAKEELNQKKNFRATEEKRDDLIEVVSRVREAYCGKDRNDFLLSTNETLKVTPDLTTLESKDEDFRYKDNNNYSLSEIEQPKTSEQTSSLLWTKKISENYNKHERSRIDKIKAGFSNDMMRYEAERKQVLTKPSFLKQATRLVMDKLGIKIPGSEERRNREAMHVALVEYHEEKLLREKEWEENIKIEEAQKREREAIKEAQNRIKKAQEEEQKAQKEQEELERDMQGARSSIEREKLRILKAQRIQEIVEKDLNSRLLKVEDLEAETFFDNPEIQKHKMIFEGSEIPVYDLKGLPFTLLSHTVDYRNANNPLSEIGQNTYREVMKNPGVWIERKDKAMEASGYGTRNKDARGDTICASFWDSKTNINSYVYGKLIYGFEQVSADSIIDIFTEDGGTKNIYGKKDTTLSNPNVLNKISRQHADSDYNEVLLRRYSENGIPKSPDYIITDGTVSEIALKHANFFNIPIININKTIYEEKMKARGEELLNSINEKNTYLELNQKLEELLSMREFRKKFGFLSKIGPNIIPTLSCNADELEKRLFEVSKLEQQKRLEFIEDLLENYTSEIEQATRENKLAPRPNQVKDLSIQVFDARQQISSYEDADKYEDGQSVVNFIKIFLKLENGFQDLETIIYDGKNYFNREGTIRNDQIKPEELGQEESSFYHKFEPLVRRYFEAYRKNRKINKDN